MMCLVPLKSQNFRMKTGFPLWLKGVKNVTYVHEDVGSIVGLAQWVKNQELLQSQMCLGYGIAVAAV